MRLKQAKEKGITDLFFNDNYPLGCGSHKTLCHSMNEIKDYMKVYHVFPNIYPGKIKTGEGFFNEENNKYPMFLNDRIKYRWNTYVKLH